MKYNYGEYNDYWIEDIGDFFEIDDGAYNKMIRKSKIDCIIRYPDGVEIWNCYRQYPERSFVTIGDDKSAPGLYNWIKEKLTIKSDPE